MHSAIFAVQEFHQKMNQHIGDPRNPDLEVDTQLRWELIREEFEELTLALEGKSKNGPLTEQERLVAVADALGDIAYVLAGAAVTWGIDLGGVFDAIHTSNMTKHASNKRKDGKILKGADYRPPDIQGALNNAKAECEAFGFGEDKWWPMPTKIIQPFRDALKRDEKKAVVEAMKSIPKEANFSDNYPLASPEAWVNPAANASFGKNELPAEMSEKLLTDDSRDTDPTILYNGQFLNRGAFLFDCPCGRKHEILTRLGSRGGLATEGEATCICGKVYKVKFNREKGEHAEFEVSDLGGHT